MTSTQNVIWEVVPLLVLHIAWIYCLRHYLQFKRRPGDPSAGGVFLILALFCLWLALSNMMTLVTPR